MQNTKAMLEPGETSRMCTLSGHMLDLRTVEHILLSHGSVREVEVTVVTSGKKEKLSARVTLKSGCPPSNELKSELAWLVVSDLGFDVTFKNIELITEESKKAQGPGPLQVKGELLHISGHPIDTKDVAEALERHGAVVKATVLGHEDGRKGNLLRAYVTLKDGVTPTNDLKSELAWFTQSQVSPYVVFKDIEFGHFDELKEPLKVGEHESVVIVDNVSDDGMAMHISSHRISTTEVTMTLLRHPDVADAAVVTVPDEGVGEKMRAFVKLKDGVEPTNDLKLELAWYVVTELKPVVVFKSLDLEPHEAELPSASMRQKAIKEQVLISGKTVLSGEVERVLESHGSVTGAVVVSVPDEKHGEILKAFVTLDEGVPRTEALTEELAWLARTELGPEVVFKSIDFKGFLPHAEDKEALRSILWADAMDIPTRVSITVTD